MTCRSSFATLFLESTYRAARSSCNLIESPKANFWTDIEVDIQKAQAQAFQIRDVQARDIFGSEVSPSELSRICSESDMQLFLKEVVADDVKLLRAQTDRLQRIAFDVFDRNFNKHRTRKWSTFDKLFPSCMTFFLSCLCLDTF